MKILIIGRGYDVAGGVSKYVYNLMTHMDLHNIEVEFIAHAPEDGCLSTEQELLNRGITCYHAPWEIKDVEKYLKKFFKTHNDYDYEERELLDDRALEQDKNFVVGYAYYKLGKFYFR